jgi:hypothetical protein
MAYKKSGRNGKKMNIPANIFLNNVYVLYAIFLIAVGNLFYLLLENNILFVMIFMIIGFLTSFFNKNMIVILTTTLVFTNILKYGIGIRHTEGLENDDKKEPDDKKEHDDKKKEQMVPEIDKDLDKYNIDGKDKVIKDQGSGSKGKPKSDNTTKENQIMMDLANMDDEKLTKLNKSLEKQKSIIDNLSSMTPVIKTLDSFAKEINLNGKKNDNYNYE